MVPLATVIALLGMLALFFGVFTQSLTLFGRRNLPDQQYQAQSVGAIGCAALSMTCAAWMAVIVYMVRAGQ